MQQKQSPQQYGGLSLLTHQNVLQQQRGGARGFDLMPSKSSSALNSDLLSYRRTSSPLDAIPSVRDAGPRKHSSLRISENSAFRRVSKPSSVEPEMIYIRPDMVKSHDPTNNNNNNRTRSVDASISRQTVKFLGTKYSVGPLSLRF